MLGEIYHVINCYCSVASIILSNDNNEQGDA